MTSGSSAHLPAPASALADAVFPASERYAKLARDAALIVGFALFTAALAQVKIPLGFTPVPITGQTLAVLLTGAALGSRRGAAAMLLYLAAGAWLPFYAGGASGFVWALSSGGYIIGFIPAAFVVGWLAERGWDRRPQVLAAMLAGNVVLYIPGLIQLSFFVQGIDPSVADDAVWLTTLQWGLYPFIPGDVIKILVASAMLPASWWVVRRVNKEVLRGTQDQRGERG
jgi:biotin transport system substrate-specific component